GGLSTIYSYGVKIGEDAGPDALRAAFDDALPRNHRHFFKHLKLSVTVGDYYFVHAGVRGGIPLNRQSEHDQLWIRDVFLNATGDFGKIVVHGHTPTSDPVIRSNRIGIDTGAYATGKLTALVLEGANRRFLTT
ncbi:MAG: serine/threonine protein phosphatase, partial [Pseudomonadota bacterium]|nr:serine/threonine protein phosphatase [Pseudomonadota bacterium]